MTTSLPLWRKIQRDNFTSLEKLCAYLELLPTQVAQLTENKHFPLNLPLRLAQKIEKKNLHDPLFKQFIPLQAETVRSPCFTKDPVGDCKAANSPKYLKKYAGRVLLMPTGACAMHCRYCFRQNYPYASLQTGLEQELDWIAADLSIKEVILSGGDPLSLNHPQLQELLDRLCAIAHVERIRFHTRFPIGIPERIDTDLLSLFAACSKQIWLVIHCNHPRELDCEVLSSLKKVQKLGIPVLNQSVLLNGVNDSIETLQSLCETLIGHGIFPYYLHQLDRVEGATHFEVSLTHGRELIAELNKRLAGYGIPKYVQELFSEPAKTLIL
jgi:EF-P beta-lysylation protein EpmB